MSEIPTIRDAQQALDTLQRFLGAMSTMFGQITEAPQGTSPSRSASAPKIAPKTTRTYVSRSGKMTWKQRIAAILTDSNIPLRPTDITSEFIERYGWNDKRSKLGSRVRSTLAFMKKDGEAKADDSGNYYLISQEDMLR